MSDEQLIAMPVERAVRRACNSRARAGCCSRLTKRVPESALGGEITDHVGYDKHDAAGRSSGNSRNGTRGKTVPTDVGPVEVRVPRDVAGTFEPQIIRKRRRRLTGVDETVLSLSAKGLAHGENRPGGSPAGSRQSASRWARTRCCGWSEHCPSRRSARWRC